MKKHLPFVAGMASLALILGAYSFEHIGGLYPCKLCLWQRYPHFLNILLIFFFIFFQEIFRSCCFNVHAYFHNFSALSCWS